MQSSTYFTFDEGLPELNTAKDKVIRITFMKKSSPIKKNERDSVISSALKFPYDDSLRKDSTNGLYPKLKYNLIAPKKHFFQSTQSNYFVRRRRMVEDLYIDKSIRAQLLNCLRISSILLDNKMESRNNVSPSKSICKWSKCKRINISIRKLLWKTSEISKEKLNSSTILSSKKKDRMREPVLVSTRNNVFEHYGKNSSFIKMSKKVHYAIKNVRIFPTFDIAAT